MSSKLIAAAAAGASYAQQPDPLDAVPERIPFDVPYGPPISLERADAALTAAVNESRAKNWKLVCAVVDSGGIPLVDAGRIIGAIGCSGGTGSQDEVAARAGVATVK